jgi:hypothetical protein
VTVGSLESLQLLISFLVRARPHTGTGAAAFVAAGAGRKLQKAGIENAVDGRRFDDGSVGRKLSIWTPSVGGGAAAAGTVTGAVAGEA